MTEEPGQDSYEEQDRGGDPPPRAVPSQIGAQVPLEWVTQPPRHRKAHRRRLQREP